MRYIIIEDERFAYEELKRMMRNLRPDYELAGWAQSIEQAVLLLRQDGTDLVLADIQLSDGMCFDAFERCPVHTPVIFTTAYDEFALKAFRLNSVDYLLKPVEEADLSDALDKLELNRLVRPTSERYGKFVADYMRHTCKNRFLIRTGDDFRYVATPDVACFYSEDKCTMLLTGAGRSFVVDYTLDQLEQMLDRGLFFRAARHCIVNVKSVKKVSRYFGGRLRLTLVPECPHEVTVSRGRAADFLRWLDDRQAE